MTNNDTISLTNYHGLFTAPVDQVQGLLIRTAGWPLSRTRREAAGCCGFPEGVIDEVFETDTWLEVCIMWADSGNYTL